MNYKLITPLYTFIILLFVIGCKKEYESIEDLDQREIQNYIKQNNLSLQKDSLGNYYQVVTPGNGPLVEYSKILPIIYTVKSLDGRYAAIDTFENRYGGSGQYLGYFTPAGLRTTIKNNLQKGGGVVRVIVPSHLAYGRNGSGSIPGNSSLDYTVKVLNEAALPAYDDISIEKYKAANGLTGFTRTTDGISYKITTMGTGSNITVDSTITAHYTGKLLNGRVFDSAVGDQSITIKLSDVVPGWQKTIPFIKEGGSIRILIPSKFGYGMAGSTNAYTGAFVIPPFSCLDFEITVTDVKSQ